MSSALKVLACLNEKPGVTAREIAKHLDTDKPSVNSHLYRLLGQGKVRQDGLNWFLQTSAPTVFGSDKLEGFSQSVVSETSPARFIPTEEQQAVIDAHFNSRQFVEAGPGTGKTDTLVAKLKSLTSAGGLGPSEVLVLSFSVAAIRELKNRIERMGAEGDSCLAFIEIRTFDSFASRLLRQWTASAELRNMDYDARISRLTTDLKTRKEAGAALREYKHVLLDEMQDLVGVRADFALELLRLVNCGFTLFGDSAQGIYDFQIEGGLSPTTSSDLLRAIRSAFPLLDDKHIFTKNFRVGGNTNLEEIAVHGRALLLESSEKARTYLEHKFSSLPLQGSTGAPKISSDLLNSATCVVCRTNGQVLRLAGQLRELQIPFEIARDKNENVPPPWIGRMFLGWPMHGPTVRRQEFIARASEVLSLDTSQAHELWTEFVSSLGLSRNPSFDVNVLRAAITDGGVLPDVPLFRRDTNLLHLSTIHKSKGREFTNVIIVMNTDEELNRARDEDRLEKDAEPKILFVALTRAKHSLRKMEAKAKGIWMQSERWIRTFPNPKGFKVLSSFQVGLRLDVDVNSFALGEAEDVVENQRILVERIRPGNTVDLLFERRDGNGCPIYKLLVENAEGKGLCVGYMSTAFGWALWHTLNNLNNPRNVNQWKPKSFPTRITGLWVKELQTIVGDTSDDAVDRLFRTSGLWLGITIDGLGNCEWK